MCWLGWLPLTSKGKLEYCYIVRVRKNTADPLGHFLVLPSLWLRSIENYNNSSQAALLMALTLQEGRFRSLPVIELWLPEMLAEVWGNINWVMEESSSTMCTFLHTHTHTHTHTCHTQMYLQYFCFLSSFIPLSCNTLIVYCSVKYFKFYLIVFYHLFWEKSLCDF